MDRFFIITLSSLLGVAGLFIFLILRDKKRYNATPIGPITKTELIEKAGRNEKAQTYVAERLRQGITCGEYDEIVAEIQRIRAEEGVQRFVEAHPVEQK